ncbi:phenylalanine--tRNA ligase subunit beta [Sulfurospirillum diekertiae]|uniref:Phenylalanine--tRNA ligase beta subunit n=1 Tax=Sulfurospirillum diekertiae TaxID=1854492 RepID=A0A1Y0HIH6_9BACT|nr:phenylalanine--tRNA ligase subunit beta [Sulfurospirillum diekertiae]ARU47899.1 Phenylalanine--tRNA ligase beta subunit [Sulfurospirillum diekertiae]ASC92745.1 Phenylalanine--tRNA ligase beta subunit [Sulfurospirillum diekertiae]
MIVTKQWLNEWIDISAIDTDKISVALNAIGLEVDGLTKIRIPENVVVGHVVSCEKHPNADKLNVCQVDVGATVQQIVCGAKNVAAGQMVAVALIGSVLPGGLKIKKAKLRDVESCGMICSSTELGLPKINDGIMILDESIGKLELGKPLCEYLLINDDVIEIGLTPNRGDCQSVYGVARDLSVYFDLEVKTLGQKEEEENQPGVGRVLHLHGSEALSGSYMYKVFDNKEIGVPLLVELRLGFAEVESSCLLGKLIDYSTYVTGVLLRAYNQTCFGAKDDKAKITIAKDENGLDAIYGLNGQKIAIAGVAQMAECKASASDERIIIEANYTHPEIIASRSANKKLGADKHLYRSSRGSEPQLAFGLNYFFKMLNKRSKIMAYADSQQITQDFEAKIINIHQSDLTEMIGEEIPKNKIIKILKQLGFGVNFAFEQDVINVKIPQFRSDVINTQDICEEIVRIVGIDNIHSKPYSFAEKLKINQPYLNFKKRQMYRYRAVAAGFFETLHFVFDDSENAKKFHLPLLKETLEVANPITSELNTLRSSLLPNILNAVSNNLKFGKKRVALFEVGSVFDSERTESKKIAFVFSGENGIPEISNHGKPSEIDFFAFAEKIQSVLSNFTLLPLEKVNGLCSPYEAARVIIDGVEAGYMARVNIQVEKELDLDRTYICELDFEALSYKRKIAKEYSKLPSSSRDLSLLVDAKMQYSELESFITSIAPKALTKFAVIDRYVHESLGDKVSLTLKLQFQSLEKTFEEEEIASMVEALLAQIQEKFGITIR